MSKKKAVDEEKKEAVLVLTGAASLFSGGVRFVKGEPKQVDDPELVKKLIGSGLFEEVGDN